MRSREQLARDLKVGYALAGAATVILVALVFFDRWGGEAVLKEKLGFSPWIAVLIYVAGEIIDGLVIGLLKPLARTWLGTFIVAYCAGIPFL